MSHRRRFGWVAKPPPHRSPVEYVDFYVAINSRSDPYRVNLPYSAP
ncbi:MAG: hypothetical protein LBP75_07720 [Planctomycetota bacterium]|jgi:hypothetical protein|nr:hypothetical protein [Planctomycetota bacterium]